LGVEGDVADLVDDQQGDPLEALELFFEAAKTLCFGQGRDPFGGGAELDALSGEAGPDPQSDREVCFASAGRAEQDHVLFAGEEVELAEVLDQRLLD